MPELKRPLRKVRYPAGVGGDLAVEGVGSNGASQFFEIVRGADARKLRSSLVQSFFHIEIAGA